MGKLPQDMEPLERVSFETNVMLRQMETEELLENFVSDRSMWCAVAYSNFISKEAYPLIAKLAEVRNQLMKIKGIRPIFVHVPIEFPLHAD